jgi:hypothetical protein
MLQHLCIGLGHIVLGNPISIYIYVLYFFIHWVALVKASVGALFIENIIDLVTSPKIRTAHITREN